MFFFFFFQAEDGIRDGHVTGVQTCALPIYPPEVIVDEIQRLAAEGCREVTLLGQTVNAYRRDLTPRTDLGELFARVAEVPDIARIRFTTSNPYNLTPKLIRAMRDVDKVCEYFHLPLQSGSNDVLARMNRGYTRER